LALVYVGIVVITMFLEPSLVFVPTRYPGGNWQSSNLDFEDVHFAAADGTRLNGWFVPHDHPRAVMLLAHGNGGNLTHRIDMLQELHQLGAAVMIFDYRRYGRSEGSPNETGILSDARAARAWLAKRAGIAENQIVLVGESLGTGVAVDLAASDGARGLILISAFISLLDSAASHYPWLPVRLLMRNRLDSLAKVGRYHGPLLAVHGDADRIVPYELGHRLFNAANERKRLIVVHGSDHNDPSSNEFYKAVDRFFDSL
jgi:fermentation-respiration switch protein FrsA (DUF1100 family)